MYKKDLKTFKFTIKCYYNDKIVYLLNTNTDYKIRTTEKFEDKVIYFEYTGVMKLVY